MGSKVPRVEKLEIWGVHLNRTVSSLGGTFCNKTALFGHKLPGWHSSQCPEPYTCMLQSSHPKQHLSVVAEVSRSNLSALGIA